MRIFTCKWNNSCYLCSIYKLRSRYWRNFFCSMLGLGNNLCFKWNIMHILNNLYRVFDRGSLWKFRNKWYQYLKMHLFIRSLQTISMYWCNSNNSDSNSHAHWVCCFCCHYTMHNQWYKWMYSIKHMQFLFINPFSSMCLRNRWPLLLLNNYNSSNCNSSS